VTLDSPGRQTTVGENNGTDAQCRWLGHALTRSYSGGLSQIILRKNSIAGGEFQVITDAG